MRSMIYRVFSVLFCVLFMNGALLAQDDGEGGPPDGVPPGPPDGIPRDRDPNGNVTSRHLLLPPEGAANQDANGDAWLKENPQRSAINVLVRRLEPGVTYEVVMTCNGGSETIGSITIQTGNENGDGGDGGGGTAENGDGDGPGVGKLRLDTRRGDVLPFDATSVADLVGCTVSVNNSETVLAAEIVDLKVHGPGSDNGGDGGDGGGAVAAEDPFGVSGLHDASFLRGDANMDGLLDISDAVNALGLLFQGTAPPYCLDAVDANDDGELDISDPITSLNFLFSGGADLPPPSFESGFDPTADGLFCDGARSDV